MKTNRLLTAAAAIALALNTLSCEQDVYDKGEGQYSLMRADLVEAHANGEKNIDYVLTDDGDSLAVNEPLAPKWVVTPDSVYRAALYYNKVDNHMAQPVSISRVPTATIRPLSDYENGVKTDPIGVESIWLSRSRRFLNLGIILKNGSSDDEEALHTLGVVGDTIMQNADGTRTYHLRLYHDQGAMPQYYSQRTYFSIPIQSYGVDSVSIRINTYDGEVLRQLRVAPAAPAPGRS